MLRLELQRVQKEKDKLSQSLSDTMSEDKLWASAGKNSKVIVMKKKDKSDLDMSSSLNSARTIGADKEVQAAVFRYDNMT